MKRKVAIILVLVFLLSQFALSVSALSNPFSGFHCGFRYEGSLTGDSASVTAKLTYAATLENIKTVGSAFAESPRGAACYTLSLNDVKKGFIQQIANAPGDCVILPGRTTCTYYLTDINTNTYYCLGTLTK